MQSKHVTAVWGVWERCVLKHNRFLISIFLKIWIFSELDVAASYEDVGILDESGPIWSSLKWIVQLHKMSLDSSQDTMLSPTEQALLNSKRVRELRMKGMMTTDGLQSLLTSLRKQLLQGTLFIPSMPAMTIYRRH